MSKRGGGTVLESNDARGLGTRLGSATVVTGEFDKVNNAEMASDSLLSSETVLRLMTFPVGGVTVVTSPGTNFLLLRVAMLPIRVFYARSDSPLTWPFSELSLPRIAIVVGG
mmetsp:Transcript_2666/g.4861  ORF Transcript_2666/g.4861 Transcript_2666/m.4861 type:complete len:112 (+) Transcript_2666:901-1236(+)